MQCRYCAGEEPEFPNVDGLVERRLRRTRTFRIEASVSSLDPFVVIWKCVSRSKLNGITATIHHCPMRRNEIIVGCGTSTLSPKRLELIDQAVKAVEGIGGRKSKYDRAMILEAMRSLPKDATIKVVATRLGITESTLRTLFDEPWSHWAVLWEEFHAR